MASRREYEMLFQLNAQLDGSYNSTFKSAQSQIVSIQKEVEAFNKVQSNITAYEKQQAAVEATKKKLEVLQQQYNNIQKEISETSEYSSTLENKLLAKQQQIDKTNVSIDAQTEKLNKLGTSLQEAGINTGSLRDEEAKLAAQIDDLKQKQVDAADKANSFGNVASNAFGAVHQAIVAAGISVALKEVYDYFASTAEAAMEFESAITGVAKTTDLTEEELAAMAASIKELSTEIPATTTELSAVAETAGQLGIAKESLLSFTEVMTMLGTATNMTADEAATMLARFANITRMDPSLYSNIGAVIVELGNNFATTEKVIADMGMNIASAGTQIGMTQSEIMGVAAALSSLGLEAQAGGTAISKLMVEMAVSVETGSDRLDEFAGIAGMTSDEFKRLFGSDSTQAMAAFFTGLGSGGESAISILTDMGITETRLRDTLLRLANAKGIFAGAVDMANNAMTENTALVAEAEKRYATTQSKLTLMQNAYNNLKIAVGDNYTPAMQKAYEVGAKVLGELTEFVEKHPEVVKAITAFTGVVGVATAGLTGYAVATKVATIFTGTFTTAAGASLLGPILLTVGGVAALTAGLVALASITKSEQEELTTLTATSREQYYHMRELQEEYDKVSTVMGETHYEATILRGKLDEATEAYKENKRTAKEMAEEHETVIKAHEELVGAYDKTIAGVEKEARSNINLMNRLNELVAVEGKTEAAKQEILTIVEMLNEAVPELGLSYDGYKDSLNMTADALERVIEAEIAQDKYMANKDELKKFKEKQAELKKALDESTAEAAARQRELAKAQENLAEASGEVEKSGAAKDLGVYRVAVNMAQSAVEEATSAEKEAQATYDENRKSINEITNAMAGYAEKTGESGEMVQNAISGITNKINTLSAQYDEAYKAALSSIEGQYSLWDKAAKVVPTSAAAINDALKGQADYWDKYNKNLANLTDRSAGVEGLSEMLATFADGSKESVNAIAGMAKASDKDLAAMVKNWQSLKEEQKLVADSIGEVKTGYSDLMDAFKKEIENAISGMDISDEATQSGKKTIEGFVKGAEKMIPEVQAAYKKIADAAMEALSGHAPVAPQTNLGTYGPYPYAVNGSHADGLDYVPFDGYIAELHKGERVLTAEEAQRTEEEQYMTMLVEHDTNAEAVSAQYGGAVSISLEYSPQYEVKGENTNEIKAVLQEHDNNLRDFILDVLESAGIDAARGAYV